MKKTLKTLTAFLVLFAFLSGRTPVCTPFLSNTDSGIALCTDDDENDYEAIMTQ